MLGNSPTEIYIIIFSFAIGTKNEGCFTSKVTLHGLIIYRLYNTSKIANAVWSWLFYTSRQQRNGNITLQNILKYVSQDCTDSHFAKSEIRAA